MKARKVLVTGGTGFMGCNFIRHIVSMSEAISLSRGQERKSPEYMGCKKVYGDITDITLLSNLLAETDAVVNFAGESNVGKSIVDPQTSFRSNTEGMFVLLEALRKAGENKRLIQVSSDQVYGPIAEGSFTEEDRLRPSNPYAASKAAAEQLCSAYHRTYGLDIILTRSANNLGPFQAVDKLIPKTIVMALTGQKVPVCGDGEDVREWLHVSDHCSALGLVLDKGESGEVYNVASGEELTVLQVVMKTLRLLGKDEEQVEFVLQRTGHDRRFSIDASKLTELGWSPRLSFDSALEKTVKWYTENEAWWMPNMEVPA